MDDPHRVHHPQRGLQVRLETLFFGFGAPLHAELNGVVEDDEVEAEVHQHFGPDFEHGEQFAKTVLHDRLFQILRNEFFFQLAFAVGLLVFVWDGFDDIWEFSFLDAPVDFPEGAFPQNFEVLVRRGELGEVEDRQLEDELQKGNRKLLNLQATRVVQRRHIQPGLVHILVVENSLTLQFRKHGRHLRKGNAFEKRSILSRVGRH